MGTVMCPYGLVSRCVLPYFSGWVVGKSVGAVVGLPYPAASPSGPSKSNASYELLIGYRVSLQLTLILAQLQLQLNLRTTIIPVSTPRPPPSIDKTYYTRLYSSSIHLSSAITHTPWRR